MSHSFVRQSGLELNDIYQAIIKNHLFSPTLEALNDTRLLYISETHECRH